MESRSGKVNRDTAIKKLAEVKGAAPTAGKRSRMA